MHFINTVYVLFTVCTLWEHLHKTVSSFSWIIPSLSKKYIHIYIYEYVTYVHIYRCIFILYISIHHIHIHAAIYVEILIFFLPPYSFFFPPLYQQDWLALECHPKFRSFFLHSILHFLYLLVFLYLSPDMFS